MDALETEQARALEAKQRIRSELATAQGEEDSHDEISRATEASRALLPLSVVQAKALPDRKQLLEALQRLQSGEVASQGSQSPNVGSAQLARVTFATYALVLDDFLQEADGLQDSTWYWSHIEDSSWSASIYLIQTLPSRLALLGQESYRILSELGQSPTPGGGRQASASQKAPKVDRHTVAATIQQLRKTPDVVLGALWPHSIDSDISLDDYSAERSGVTASSIRQRSHGGKVLAGPLMLMRKAKRLSPLTLTVHEAHAKRKLLLQRRNKVAEQLGTMVLAALPISQGSSEGALQTAWTAEGLDSESRRLIGILEEQLGVDNRAAKLSESLSLPQSLYAILSASPAQDKAAAHAPIGLSPPSRLSIIWPRLVLYPALLLFSLRLASKNRDVIHETLQNARETAKGFFQNWIVQPISELLDTIRGGDVQEEAGGSIVTKEGRKADLESLERMVTQYAVEKGQISADDVARREILRQKVREGDLDVVMLAYEDQLKSPLKSLTLGSLPRLLLIQVQKAKYDLAVAMSGIDHLLKSQALLFGAVGIAPAMGIVWASFKGSKWVLRGRDSDSADDIEREKQRAWSSMRKVDRLLTSSSRPRGSRSEEQWNARSYGNLLLELSALRKVGTHLLSSRGHRRGRKAARKAAAAGGGGGRSSRQDRLAAFLEDIRELESIAASSADGGGKTANSNSGQHSVAVSAQKAAVERMWRCWGSLFQVSMW